MPDLWIDVDTAVKVPVNILPLIDDTDFKSIETAVAYNATGLALTWNFVTCAGVVSGTAVTPTTGGDYDWSEPIADKGMYQIEIPASGGASINNDTEGVGWFTGVATGVLPWRGPTIGFRRAALNDLFIDGGTASTNLEDFFDGTGYAGGTAKLGVDVVSISGDSTAADNLESYTDGTTPQPVNTTQISGDATAADNLEAACDGNTYNVGGGAVVAASVTGAVGSVTGAVGSVTGAVGSVTGSVGSVTGAVGSVTGNVGGNVTGSVGSVAAGGITAASIATGAIDADAIADNAIDAGAIANDAITAAKIADGAIDAATFAAGAITAASIATGAIDADAIADNAIDAGAIASDAITAAKIADAAIDAATFAAGAITAGAIAADAIGASELAADAVAEIADQVWDELIAGHAGVGSTGAALSAAGGSGDPWSTAVPGAYGAGTAGYVVGTNLDAAVSTRTKPADTQAAVTSVGTVTGNVNGSVGSVTGAVGSVTGAVGSVTGAVGSVTGNVGGNVTGSVGSVAAGGITAASIATGAIDADALAADAIDEILDEAIGDSTLTMRQVLKLVAAALGGKSSGGGTTTVTFRNVADSANVIVATVDTNGNRSGMTLTV